MAIATRSKLLAAGALAAMATVATPLPASAQGSPPPKVKISALSKPTTGPDGSKVYSFDVTARDPDGFIDSVEITVVGENYQSGQGVFVTCMPGAPAGQPVTFQVSERLPSTGTYRVHATATSISSCDEFGEMQASRVTTRRFVVKS